MRRRVHATQFLSLAVFLLLLMYGAGGCLAAAHRRAFDEELWGSGRPPTAMVRELPRKGQGATQAYTVATSGEENSGWAPLRIAVSTEDLKDPRKHCTKEGEMKPDFRGHYSPCTKDDVLTSDVRKTLVDEILPVAVGLHAERLLVQRMKTPLVVPRLITEHGRCKYFKIPEEHHTVGLKDTDMVLYVASRSNYGTWAIPCAFAEDGRPIAGALHIMPSYTLGVMHFARTTAHAIAHALGFSMEQMKKHDMLLNVTDVRGGSSPVTVVKSPVTLSKAKLHYGCDTLKGMEMVYYFDASLWSLRNAKDELMSPFGTMYAGYYTALTMAAFEDLGYYRAVWGMEEPMVWGNNSGCEFLDNPCSEETPTTYPDMFCDKNDALSIRCTSNRQAIGTCNLDVEYTVHDIKETCNAIFPPGNSEHHFFCTVEGPDTPPGSLHGKGSWCLDAEPLPLLSDDASNWKLTAPAVCAMVQCEEGKVKVKYLGGSDFEPCPEGEFITPKSDHFKGGRRIKCPRYEEVCTIAADGSSLINLKKGDHGKGDHGHDDYENDDNENDDYGKGDHDGCAAAVVLSSLLLAVIAAVVVATLPL
ncbi:surface protease GP63 [Trypanosoma rangeli]|uniref:Leishmanolysin-like peptidase n=1 Tax=Trypanosoma rangeli TaxID=5698 RepID=A0A3R7N1W7_TRYRA|nr:surface protease GP63 [Trypanosoma rangeli]RNE94972.1 surface protease GP63 [Trypanosoma rangeli]|eukprot:RNE94972.1 surface protease GP63 [Trypanosoma rangeli]